MTRTIRLVIAALLLATTACGPMNQGGLGTKAVERLGALTGLRAAPAPTPPAAPTAALDAGPGNVLMVTLVGRNAVAAMTRAGENNGVVTWRTPKGVTLSFRGGVLVASRGLNEDLMGADVNGLPAAIAAGHGTIQREHAYLDSEDQISTRNLTCTISTVGPEDITTITGVVEAIKVTENCKSTQLTLVNSYWLDPADRQILQSLQAVAPTVGYIKVNPL